MKKFISDILGSVVIIFQERAKAGEIKEIIIDPDSGKLVGLLVSQYSGEKDKVFINKDIKGFGNGIVIVSDYDAFSDIDDIVRVKNIYPNNPNIIGSKVFTESGQRLGKVQNATLDLIRKVLDKIYVEPGISMNIVRKQIIISRDKIIKIEKNLIVVSDELATIKEKKFITSQATVID